MNRTFLTITAIMLLLTGLFFSCKKHQDTPFLDVSFTSPSASEIFSVPDTIVVKFSIQSDLPIIKLSARIDNEQMIPLSPVVYLYPDEAQRDFEIPLVVDILPETQDSKAYIHLIINDGVQNDHWYLAIELKTKPLVYKGFSVITSTNQQSSTLLFFNEQGDELAQMAISGRAKKTLSLPESDLLVMATSNPEHLMAIRWEDQQVVWTKDAPFPNPSFTCLYGKAPYLYYGVGAGRVVGVYGSTGLQHMETPVFEGYQPTSIGSGGNNLIFAESSSTGLTSRISACYLNTGEIQSHYLTEFQSVFAHINSDSTIVFIGNQGSAGQLLVFDSKHIQASGGQLFDFGEIVFATAIDQNNYLMASKDAVFHYNLYTDQLHQVHTAQVEIGHLSCDTRTQLAYIGDGNTLQILDFPHFTTTGTHTFPAPVVGVCMRYVR